MKTVPSIVFILPAQPKDHSQYNAFGIHKGFGKAYAEYYAKKDAETTVESEKPPG